MRQGVWCLLPVALNAVPIHTQCSDHYLGEEASWLALSSHSAPINHTHTRTNSSSHETHGNQRFLRATSPGLVQKFVFWPLAYVCELLHRNVGRVSPSLLLGRCLGGQRVGWESEVGMKARDAGRCILLDRSTGIVQSEPDLLSLLSCTESLVNPIPSAISLFNTASFPQHRHLQHGNPSVNILATSTIRNPRPLLE